jgi:hypothetical protein
LLEPMTMWCAIVGFSGTGKTPGLEVIKRTLSAIERDKRDAINELRRKHESKVEKARAARSVWKNKVEEAAETGANAPDMPEEAQDPGKFIAPRLFVSDGTIERLAELLIARPQGIIRIIDELAGMFANMQRYSGGQDNEFWLEAWNGNSYSVERIGRQLAIDHLLVGVAGGFQPDKLVKAFKGDDDGMYARFAFSWPEEAPHKKLADEIGHIDENLKTALARLDALAEANKDGALKVREIKLSDTARAEFEKLRLFVHAQKELLDGREREWISKAPAHTLRLAGTLCLLDWAWNEGQAEPTEIEVLYLQRAIKLVREYFWPHARAALRLAGLSERHADARRVLRWVRRRGLHEISLMDVRRDALAQRLDEAETKKLLDSLTDAGWLKEAEPISTGGRPVRRWGVNPKLYAESAGSAESPPSPILSALSALPAREDLESAASAASAAENSMNGQEHPPSTGGGIPFMITRAMRECLHERGYTDTDIRGMTPRQAHDLLGD